MYKARILDLDKDYKTVKKWWKAWGWTPFLKVLLPPTGIMISYEGKDICAGWIYKTDTPICWFENIISDKGADRKIRDKALDVLLDSMNGTAKNLGFHAAMTSVSSSSLIKRLGEHGYKETDKNMTNYLKEL